MKRLPKLPTPKSVKRAIPYIGITAFAGCSVHALSEFFTEMALTPSRWYDAASWLVEGFTAYITMLLIAQAKIATASLGSKGMTKEKRRFARWLTLAYTILACITMAVSVVANTREFGGNILLGSLFPSLCVACAIAAGLDEVARAKKEETKKETTSNVEGNGSKPKKAQRELERFLAKCSVPGCDWVGNEGKPYPTWQAKVNALNGHNRKHKGTTNEN